MKERLISYFIFYGIYLPSDRVSLVDSQNIYLIKFRPDIYINRTIGCIDKKDFRIIMHSNFFRQI